MLIKKQKLIFYITNRNLIYEWTRLCLYAHGVSLAFIKLHKSFFFNVIYLDAEIICKYRKIIVKMKFCEIAARVIETHANDICTVAPAIPCGYKMRERFC